MAGSYPQKLFGLRLSLRFIFLLFVACFNESLIMSRFPLVLCVFFCLSSLTNACSQGFQVVFPGLNGNQLIDSVAQNYRPATVLDYANSRDTLYAKILAVDEDSLRCIYSGHTLYLDPTQDPTQYVYQNGGTNGINTEHAYPQGKGADAGTNAHSDMHHLFPTRIAVNEARGDKPFAEIPDPQTQKWFLNNQVYTSIPNQNIDLYAESNNMAFEPKEASKGDIARAILYFYTVYRSQANAADPNFFDIQRAVLCQWDAQDPADSSELVKTWRIAGYQDGKPNPFVVDCTLASRSWCPELSANCLASTSPIALPELGLNVFPQPVVGEAQVYMNLPFSGKLQCSLISILGQKQIVYESDQAPSGVFIIPLNTFEFRNRNTWMGFLEVNLSGANGRARQVIPVLFSGW